MPHTKPNTDPILPKNEFVFPGRKVKIVVNGLECLLYKQGGNVTQADARMTVDENYATQCVSLIPERPNLLADFMQGHAKSATAWANRFQIAPSEMWMAYFTELRKRNNQRNARRNARLGIRD